MTERKLDALRPRPRRGSDELLGRSSAEEHDHVAADDVSESGARETAKRRTVYAPRPERDTDPPAVISVTLDEDEDVEWIWTHTSDGKSVVTGYTVTKRADRPEGGLS